jgi:hypothetical protein
MLMSRRYLWVRRICLPSVVATAMFVAAAVPTPQREGFWRSPMVHLSDLWSWLGPPPAWAHALPPTPVQPTGSGANAPHELPATATRAGRGSGRAPGMGKGQLPEFHQPIRPVTAALSDSVRGRFEAGSSRRDAAKSTANTTWFENADGSVTRNAYSGIVNYKAGDGTFQPIDTALVPLSGGFAERANGLGITLAGKADALSLGTVALDGNRTVGFSLSGAAPVEALVIDSVATYPSVFPDTDVRLTTLPAGIETEFVLNSPAAAREFTLPLRTHGLRARMTAGGSVEFVDGSGAVAATIPPGSMMDSSIQGRAGGGAESRGVRYSLTTMDGGPALMVTLDGAWLDDPTRIYPVVVDPAAVGATAGTWAEAGFSGDNSGSTHLKVGTPDSGSSVARSFLQFGYLSPIAGQLVNGVSLTVNDSYAWNCASPQPFNVFGVASNWSPSGSRARRASPDSAATWQPSTCRPVPASVPTRAGTPARHRR